MNEFIADIIDYASSRGLTAKAVKNGVDSIHVQFMQKTKKLDAIECMKTIDDASREAGIKISYSLCGPGGTARWLR